GYTTIEGMPDQLAALLLAVPSGRRLVYCGKVGTGYSTAQRRELVRLLRRDASPTAAPPSGAPRVKRAIYVEPRHVAEVRFTEWTADGKLRHPVFRGLRPDKSPRDVT